MGRRRRGVRPPAGGGAGRDPRDRAVDAGRDAALRPLRAGASPGRGDAGGTTSAAAPDRDAPAEHVPGAVHRGLGVALPDRRRLPGPPQRPRAALARRHPHRHRRARPAAAVRVPQAGARRRGRRADPGRHRRGRHRADARRGRPDRDGRSQPAGVAARRAAGRHPEPTDLADVAVDQSQRPTRHQPDVLRGPPVQRPVPASRVHGCAGRTDLTRLARVLHAPTRTMAP